MTIPRRDFIKRTGTLAASFMLWPFSSGAKGDSDQKLPDLLVDKAGNPIALIPAWEEKRKELKKTWADYLGILVPQREPPAITILNEENTGDLIRQLIEYENEPGDRMKAYLLKPAGFSKPLPGVVALHSTSDNRMLYISGVEKGEISPLGYNLARKGVIVICPMCFLWHDRGERTYEEQAQRFISGHPGSKGMAKMLFDAMRAVDVLDSIGEVDSARIGAVGHSLGGKESFYLGAFDERVKVIVSNEGGIGIDFSNWDDSWYLGKEIHNFGHQHHELLALCAPKPFLLIGGDFADGVRSLPYIDAVRPVYELYGKPDNLAMFNHGSGHNVTPEAEKRTCEWITEHI
jgi:hypothetical protein